MIDQGTRDRELLRALLSPEPHDGLTPTELDAFVDMQQGLVDGTWAVLTEKQRAWVTKVHERLVPTYTARAADVPRGREVALMVGALPKRPPPFRPQRVIVERPRPVRGILDEGQATDVFRPTGLDEPGEDDE